MYHLQRTGALCHECHYNVHSNAEAQNTIYGDGTGCVVGGTPACTPGPSGSTAGLPPDAEDGRTDGVSDTHLINFAPGGPSAYSGEARCDDPGSGTPGAPGTSRTDPETGELVPIQPAGADVQCSGSDPDPNPESSGTADPNNPKSNVFFGVEGVTATLPVWYYQKDAKYDPGVFRCNLRCHGVVMSTCFYITDRSLALGMNQARNRSLNQSATWCAGGSEQSPGIIFGSAPPEIKRLLADLGKALVPGGLDRTKLAPVTAAHRAAARPITSR
jgi:hypothetical protein